MADPVTAMLVLSVAAAAGKSIMDVNATDAKMNSLDLSKDQAVIQHQQKTLSNFDTTQKILDSQIAEASTRGVGLGSSSLEAIQRHTFDVSAKRQSNLDIEESLMESNVVAEKSNVQSTLFSELFGNAAGAASDFAKVRSKMPSKGTV